MEIKKLFFFLLVFLSASSHVCSQYFPVMRYQKFYGTPGIDKANRLCLGLDSTIYIGGCSVDSVNPSKGLDGFLANIRLNGDLIWKKVIGGVGNDEIKDIVSAPDSTILFCGSSAINFKHNEKGDTTDYSDYWIGKINAESQIIWQKNYGGSDRDFANGITSNLYAGAVVTGFSWSDDFDVLKTGNGLNDQWITLLNRRGELMRGLLFGGKKNDWGNSIIRTKDGSYISVGFTTSHDIDKANVRINGDAWILKIDFAGNWQWQKIIREPYEDNLVRLCENSYGFVYTVGSSFVDGLGKQFWLVKCDPKSGGILINKKWGGTGHEELTGIAACEDGGVVMTGYSYYENLENEYIKGGYDLWVIRMDGYGNILWQKTFGGADYEVGADILCVGKHIFVLGTKLNKFNKKGPSTDHDFWLIDLEEVSCEEVQPMFTTDVVKNEEQVGKPIKFSNKSNAGERFLWDFGDGSNSTERDPIKTYTRPGFFTPTLTVFINETCYKTYTIPKRILVY